jgi:hypothetical protein
MMAATAQSLLSSPADGPPPRPAPLSRVSQAIGWLALTCLLAIAVPLFVRMPLWPDVAFYDICARDVLQGGALERDFLFLGPPGMVWARVLVRSLFGWSSEAIRLIDLAILSAIVGLMIAWLRALGLSRGVGVWVVVFLLAFYLTASEWVHCQPDTWMLLPALTALHLRGRQLERLAGPPHSRRAAAWGTLEGMCWGIGCLIKPFVVVPGLFAWLTSAALLRRSGPGWLSRLACDAAGLLAGGLLMAALWQGWLIGCGTWHAYWHNNATYSGEFYSTSFPLWVRPFLLLLQLPPWGALHLIAVPVALAALTRVVLTRQPLSVRGSEASSTLMPLLAAFYLGWLIQSAFIQSEFDYHIAPTLLLALALVAGWLVAQPRPRWGWVWLVGGVIIVLCQPAFAPSRLAYWGRCWRGESSPEMHDRLALRPGDMFATNWQDLEQVEVFLRNRQVSDGELICYDGPTIPLYLQLGVRPGERFLFPSTKTFEFIKHREAIRAELRASGRRYVVTDTITSVYYESLAMGKPPDPAMTDPETLSPELAQRFPYSEPVVFRAGRYLVREVRKEQ